MMDNIKVIYFGVFIHDEYSKLAILKLLQDNNIRIPKAWKKYIHHMTIAFNNGSPQFDILYNMYKDINNYKVEDKRILKDKEIASIELAKYVN